MLAGVTGYPVPLITVPIPLSTPAEVAFTNSGTRVELCPVVIVIFEAVKLVMPTAVPTVTARIFRQLIRFNPESRGRVQSNTAQAAIIASSG